MEQVFNSLSLVFSLLEIRRRYLLTDPICKFRRPSFWRALIILLPAAIDFQGLLRWVVKVAPC